MRGPVIQMELEIRVLEISEKSDWHKRLENTQWRDIEFCCTNASSQHEIIWERNGSRVVVVKLLHNYTIFVEGDYRRYIGHMVLHCEEMPLSWVKSNAFRTVEHRYCILLHFNRPVLVYSEIKVKGLEEGEVRGDHSRGVERNPDIESEENVAEVKSAKCDWLSRVKLQASSQTRACRVRVNFISLTQRIRSYTIVAPLTSVI